MSISNPPSLTNQLKGIFTGIHADQQLRYVTCLNQEKRKLLEVALKTIQQNGIKNLSPQDHQFACRANFVNDVSAIVAELLVYDHDYNFSGELPFVVNFCNFFNWFIVSLRVELCGYITSQALIDTFNKTDLEFDRTTPRVEIITPIKGCREVLNKLVDLFINAQENKYICRDVKREAIQLLDKEIKSLKNFDEAKTLLENIKKKLEKQLPDSEEIFNKQPNYADLFKDNFASTKPILPYIEPKQPIEKSDQNRETLSSISKLAKTFKEKIDGYNSQLNEINENLSQIKQPKTRIKQSELSRLESKKSRIEDKKTDLELKYSALVNFYKIPL